MASPEIIAVETVNGVVDIVLAESFRPALDEGENITCMSYHSGQLYVGTTLNRIHIFDVKAKEPF